MSSDGNVKPVGAVVVVGGGISGMQASLDLANSGFKVYMIEENTSIGGRMSQLDKTFPTNDCSMCMISPKLIEVDKHLNIEIITKSRVQSIEGEPGNFTVKVLKEPLYIDIDKCSSCGDCVDACPVTLSSEFEEGLASRKATYKRYPQAIPSANSISKGPRPPCKLTCPAGCNGQGYVALISQGKFAEALAHIKQWIPLPAAIGRICHHPCEQQCNRGEVDQPVAIAPLKRFAADIVRQKKREGAVVTEEKPQIDPSKPKVAVVGSGPSGLTCAADLVHLGYPVTIFEAGPKPGGQLQNAIPKYRLPKDVLDADIADIIDLGIELKLNTPINGDFSLVDLKAQGYQAVYLGIGAVKGRGLPIPGKDLPQVLLSLDFLRDANMDADTGMGKRVVVVGGGNVAMDVARAAVRLGASEVNVVCLESREEMPAHAWEIEEAIEEGVKMNPSWGPKQIIEKGGKVSAIEFDKCLSVFDSQKRFAPVFDKENVASFECDTVIMAIGQATDLSVLPADTKVKNNRGFIICDPVTLATDEAGVFAGGDGVTGSKSAVEAISHGHEAAISIDRYLNGVDLSKGREKPQQESAPLPEGKHEKVARIESCKIPLEKRISSFDEIEITFTEEQAIAEAARCLNCGLCSECMQCVSVCQAHAIDHTMQEEVLNISAGSVVLAPGFKPYDPNSIEGDYGYSRMPNVVTALEFERILSASGPYQGHVLRPSDGQHPVRVAWIQCVGSRKPEMGRDYCSSVCCMYATKQAIIAREHDSRIEPTIFYMDIRAFGKGFERYYVSAQEKFGVKYIKAMPTPITMQKENGNVVLEYTGDDGQKVYDEFDMVVLSIGLEPSAGTKQLAEIFSIGLDRFGFCQTDELKPNRTSTPGVYVCGAADAPMDIPESVMNASAAASLASKDIIEARGTLISQKEYPTEKDVIGQEPRVGVFVCRCGSNIARVVDVPSVVESAKDLPNVVYAEENLYTCSTDTQVKIIKAIEEHNLNRVVVASCSPRTHEPLFQDTCREAGLNKFLFEMANIRDQCSWVHATHMPEATDKAKDLVRMAVARAVTLEPLHQYPTSLTRTALVIGGGVSGMTAALGLADQGYESVLLERTSELGGNAKNIYYTPEKASDPQALLADLKQRIADEPRVTVYTNAELKQTSGYLGNYTSRIHIDGEDMSYAHGVVIMAVGGVEYKPEGEYLYGQSDKVLTQHELEGMIVRGEIDSDKLNSVVMIQCVGSREPEHQYCSRICCTQAVKNAIKLKEANPGVNVYVLYRDIRTYAMKELAYEEARAKGVLFIRYEADAKPEVSEADGKLKIKVYDPVIQDDLLIPADILVLSAAIRPQPDAVEFASRLKLPLTADGFYMEAHMKLRPLDFVNEGMYLCGLAHSPKFISESIAQAQGAVSRAVTVLSQPHLMAGGVVSVVDPGECVACLTCVRVCPFNVPRINENGVAEIEAAACQGCGICAASCPCGAISVQHYKDAQIMAKTSVLC